MYIISSRLLSTQIKVQGDTVTIAFNSGYSRTGRQWGFKVSAKAFLEEESLELPWLLDLAKGIGIFAGKCAVSTAVLVKRVQGAFCLHRRV